MWTQTLARSTPPAAAACSCRTCSNCYKCRAEEGEGHALPSEDDYVVYGKEQGADCADDLEDCDVGGEEHVLACEE